MAQHDYVIANGTGAAVRSDLNNALAAIVSQNSGATAPSTTYAYQWWADTTTGLLKLRNAANNAWITLFQLDGEWSTLAVENGTAAAPSIYFKDSGTDTGIYSPGADQVAISTNGTGRLFVDSSGRALIGTSSAQGTNQFQIAGASGSTISLRRELAPGLVNSGDYIAGLEAQDSGGNIYARIQVVADGNAATNDYPGRLIFSTTADGASSPTQRLLISQNGAAGFFNLPYIYPNTDNAASVGLNGNRWSAVWAVNGTIQTSDQRAKIDITNSQLGSDFIKSLRPVSYKWIEGGKVDSGERDENGNYIYESVPGERTHWGFIAQEVKEAVDVAGVDFGGWVLTDKDDPDSQQALRYDQFIAPLTKALQEAFAKIETLEAKVAALEAS
jgi:hypothetical protein